MMNESLKVFIGYDSKEPIAFHVLAHSIMRRASCQVEIVPLIQDQLRKAGIYTRERGATESTEFSLTRFLTPFLAGYKGLALFLDCDMLCLHDVAELARESYGQPYAAVLVCKHDYTPKEGTKFLGNVQTVYPRKNWSSLMLFNLQNWKNRALTKEYVNSATGAELHRFNWMDDERIGSLDLSWNHLVGENNQSSKPSKIVHYTLGGPWFDEYKDCEYAKEWMEEFDRTIRPMKHC